MLDAAREAAHEVTVAIQAEEAASAQADSDGILPHRSYAWLQARAALTAHESHLESRRELAVRLDTEIAGLAD